MLFEVGKYVGVGNGIVVRKNKNNTFTYYYNSRINGKPTRTKLFTADKYNNSYIKKAIQNINQLNLQVYENITINSLAEKYFENRKKKAIGELKRKYNYITNEKEFYELQTVKSKLKNIKMERNKYLKNVYGSNVANKNIFKLTKKDFIDYLDNDLNLKGLSEKTVFNTITTIKTIINFGIKYEDINIKNPLIGFEIKNPKRKRIRFLTINELELLLKECKKHQNKNVYLAVYLAVLTAGRAGSILNIQKQDINFNTHTIRLNNYKSNRVYTVVITKKGSEWLKKITKDLKNNDYILNNKGKQLSVIPKQVYRIMDELFNSNLNKKSNWDRDNVVNFHTIRRSVATNMALQGIDIYKIMTFLNHSSIKQTQDYLSLTNINMTSEIENLYSQVFKNF